ncbi:unnamed protein product [Nesidiocoris tenuis]|uniref:Uncharacterized protein n=1 Tax=Nesidiocoris tenuis TaxID=355587 RepID=A0A6H5HJC6_9HEMI|nr:unnamed protein product [Nesidiocoris tenuis]
MKYLPRKFHGILRVIIITIPVYDDSKGNHDNSKKVFPRRRFEISRLGPRAQTPEGDASSSRRPSRGPPGYSLWSLKDEPKVGFGQWLEKAKLLLATRDGRTAAAAGAAPAPGLNIVFSAPVRVLRFLRPRNFQTLRSDHLLSYIGPEKLETGASPSPRTPGSQCRFETITCRTSVKFSRSRWKNLPNTGDFPLDWRIFAENPTRFHDRRESSRERQKKRNIEEQRLAEMEKEEYEKKNTRRRRKPRKAA